MEGGEVGVALGDGEGAEREAEGDVVEGVGGRGWGDAGVKDATGICGIWYVLIFIFN